MSSWEGGKGSKPRPISDRKQFEDNWDRIFNKKNQDNENKSNEVKDNGRTNQKM